MKAIILSLLIFCFVSLANAQEGKDKDGHKYAPAQVIDSVYGITMYDNMNPQIGGDSSRTNAKGYAAQGWIEDYYLDGKLLHKGFYEDGQLKMYKNYFPDGTIERSFKIIDFKKCTMNTYHPTGKLKVDIVYYDGGVLTSTDYYPNGTIEYQLENSKTLEYLIFRKSFNADGTPQEIFELVNEKKFLYFQKEYHPNGVVRTEGTLKYNPYKMDYMKDGAWKVFDDKGVLIATDKYAYGERLQK
jgi:antitoxin component YwqK of YwqJK toxin-antitoxin module